jgi:WD40 repeat protein
VCFLCALVGLALVLFLLLTQSTPQANAQPPAAGQKPVSFINDVAPILKDRCFACHDAKKKKGKLDMTTFETLRKGGSHKDPIEDGKPDDSLMIDLLTANDSGRMPPTDTGPALPREQIDLIKRWIKEGAKLDAGLTPKADLVRELRIRWTPPAPLAAYKYPVTVNALAFTPDNKQLVVSGYHEMTVWDINSGKLTKRIRTRAERIYGMAFLPDGKLVAVGGRPGQEGDVRVFDINVRGAKRDGVEMLDGVNDKAVMLAHLLDCDDTVMALALSKDGVHLAAAGCDRLVRVWNLADGVAKAQLEQTMENHADWVFGLAFSPDGRYLLSASRDKTAKIWDLKAKESVATFSDHQNTVYGAALTSDGKQGFSVGEDGNLRFWAATEQGKNPIGKQVKIAPGGHTKAVFKLVVHPDPAKMLAATCSADGTVKLWNPGAGSATKTLTGHTDYLYAVAISPDATLVAAGGWGGEVRVWRVSDGGVVKVFNASPGYVAKGAK